MDSMKKTIIFDMDLIEKIEKMAKETERDFSGQVRWMLKEYIRIKDGRT